jgi:cytochrome c oxidase cbb3-type subunit 4
MDIDTWRGIWTLVVMITFVAICYWAWSSRRRKDFDAAARLPLEEDGSRPDGGTEHGESR